jgi:hypothetical protein
MFMFFFYIISNMFVLINNYEKEKFNDNFQIRENNDEFVNNCFFY